MRKLLKIGEVAKESKLPVKTIRYYEDLGLLVAVVQRSENGYRLFSGDIFNRLAFIKRAQALGLSLQEIKDILLVHDQGELPCGVVKNRLLFKLNQINQQIEALELLKSELQGILSAWQDKPSPDKIPHTICPNIQKNLS